jgi:hypothetical protein
MAEASERTTFTVRYRVRMTLAQQSAFEVYVLDASDDLDTPERQREARIMSIGYHIDRLNLVHFNHSTFAVDDLLIPTGIMGQPEDFRESLCSLNELLRHRVARDVVQVGIDASLDVPHIPKHAPSVLHLPFLVRPGRRVVANMVYVYGHALV